MERLSNINLIKLDEELNNIIEQVSNTYKIPKPELQQLLDNLDNKCKANIWNIGNPIRCSRKRLNKDYCCIHQSQLNKYGSLRLGNYNGKNNTKQYNLDEYDAIECDLYQYNDDYYYIDDDNNVYSILDRTNNIVELTKPEESRVITQILMEPKYEQEHL